MDIYQTINMTPAEKIAIEFWPPKNAPTKAWYYAQDALLAAAITMRCLEMHGDSEALSFLSLMAMLRALEVSELETELPSILRTQAMGPSLQGAST